MGLGNGPIFVAVLIGLQPSLQPYPKRFSPPHTAPLGDQHTLDGLTSNSITATGSNRLNRFE